MTGRWDPAGTWNPLHGDGKSTTGGKFTMATMKTSAGQYRVKVMDDGAEIHLLEYPAEPEFDTIVADLKLKYS